MPHRVLALFAADYFAPILTLVSIAVSIAWGAAYTKADRLVQHSVDVRRHATLFYQACRTAETGQRGYLLTAKPKYLTDYETGVRIAPFELKELRRLTSESPAQQKRIEVIENETAKKFQELAQTVEFVKAGNKQRAYGVVEEDRGKLYMDTITQLVTEVTDQEDNHLASLYGDSVWWFRAMVAAVLSLGFGLGLLWSWTARRYGLRPC